MKIINLLAIWDQQIEQLRTVQIINIEWDHLPETSLRGAKRRVECGNKNS